MVYSLDVIVPCFNEESVLPQFFLELCEAVAMCHVECTVIFINDGSTDQTESIINSFIPVKNIKRIKQIVLSKNQGHMIALREGLKECDSDFSVSLDCDLQDPPIFIKELVENYLSNLENIDCVVGQRIERSLDSIFKRATATLYYWLVSYFISPKIVPHAADFRLVSRNLRNTLLSYSGKYPIYRILIPLTTEKINILNFSRRERYSGQTNYTFRKMINLAFLTFFYFSNFPLKILGLFFWFFLSTNIILSITVLSAFINSNVVPGWTSSILFQLYFITFFFFCFSIVARYSYELLLAAQGLPLVLSKVSSKEGS